MILHWEYINVVNNISNFPSFIGNIVEACWTDHNTIRCSCSRDVITANFLL